MKTLLIILASISIFNTNSIAGDICDTDMACYILGATDALGSKEVVTTKNKLSITCDNKRTFISEYKDVYTLINKYCSKGAKLNYPCTSTELDYSGWCGSKEQLNQYMELGYDK